MTSRKLARLGLALLLFAPVAAVANPAGPGGPGDGVPGGGRDMLPPAGYLNLTDEQVEAVTALREELRAEMQTQLEAQRALGEQLRDAIESDQPDATLIGELAIEMHGFRDQIRTTIESFESQFTALLTAEQLAKYENFRELMRLRRSRGERGERGERSRWERSRRFR